MYNIKWAYFKIAVAVYILESSIRDLFNLVINDERLKIEIPINHFKSTSNKFTDSVVAIRQEEEAICSNIIKSTIA